MFSVNKFSVIDKQEDIAGMLEKLSVGCSIEYKKPLSNYNPKGLIHEGEY